MMLVRGETEEHPTREHPNMNKARSNCYTIGLIRAHTELRTETATPLVLKQRVWNQTYHVAEGGNT